MSYPVQNDPKANGHDPDGTIDCDMPVDVLMNLAEGYHPKIRNRSFQEYGMVTTIPELRQEQYVKRIVAEYRVDLSDISRTGFPHSMRDRIPAPIYIPSHSTKVAHIASYAPLFIKGFSIVDTRMKAVIEASRTRKSEFYPIGVILRKSRNYDVLGGGEIVEGRFWLWYVHEVLDLIDWKCTPHDPPSDLGPKLGYAFNPRQFRHFKGWRPQPGDGVLVLKPGDLRRPRRVLPRGRHPHALHFARLSRRAVGGRAALSRRHGSAAAIWHG